MFPSVEIRHLLAVIALAEELNFRRAADRLHITQPALSKQITDLEAEHQFHLFTRNKRRVVELTDAGRLFVEEARSALAHTERAVHLARAAHNRSDTILPLYPRLEIRLKTQFARESVHSVLVGEVNLALVTAPPQDAQITAVPFAPAPLYAVLPEDHPAAQKESLLLQDLAKDEWILFPKRFDPVVFDAIMDAAQSGSIVPRYAHDVIAPQQAVELVSEHLGVAVLTQPPTTGFHADGVVVKPLSDPSLCFNTCVILRADNTSRLVEEYVRMFLRRYSSQRLPPNQVKLSISA
ncbi:MAG: LysR family transcriptional regulator [Acidobacteriia bacterium]|nr:LysR family transcriptional regulator [Terriglobia bacterium]